MKLDIGEPGPDSYRTRYERVRAQYTKWRLAQLEEQIKIMTVPDIHSEFDVRLNKHIAAKGTLSNFEFEFEKPTKRGH